MTPADILRQLSKYKHVMYRDISLDEEKRLRTGDVVHLSLDDFKILLRSYPLLEPLLDSYENNSKYKAKLWAILNKPCDMVHEEGQKFKSSSLFLAPLQSFKGSLKRGEVFSDFVLPPKTLPSSSDLTLKVYNEFLKEKSSDLFKHPENPTPKEKGEVGKLRSQYCKKWRDRFSKNVVENLDDTIQPTELQSIFSRYISYLEENKEEEKEEINILSEFYKYFQGSEIVESHLELYNKTVSGEIDIRINEDKLKDLSSTVFINQMEVRGRFYYEPKLELYDESINDFSFFIELEDLLTLKVSEEAVASGALVKKLMEKRKVGLSRNYSDRLQNIMGYYYSKIGTKDVRSATVLDVYEKCFDNFFLGENT